MIRILAEWLWCPFIMVHPRVSSSISFLRLLSAPTDRVPMKGHLHNPGNVDTSPVPGVFCTCYLFQSLLPSLAQLLCLVPFLLCSQNKVFWLGQGTHVQCSQLGQLVGSMVVVLRTLLWFLASWHDWSIITPVFLGAPWTVLLATVFKIVLQSIIVVILYEAWVVLSFASKHPLGLTHCPVCHTC